jgi:iron complex transport system substrate-binding protein
MSLVGFGVAVVLVLVGCSASSGDADTRGASSNATRTTTRTVTDVTGMMVDLPVDPQRVVALDEPAALNLLVIGIRPDVAFQTWKTVVPAEVLQGLGIRRLGAQAWCHGARPAVAVRGGGATRRRGGRKGALEFLSSVLPVEHLMP